MTSKMFALTALCAFAAATPAAAQWSGSVDTQSLRAQIDDGVARGNLSAEDAASLRSQLRGLDNLQRQYAQHGMSASEREDLQQRAQGLRNEIADAEGDASPQAYGRNGSSNYSRYGNNEGNGYGSGGAYPNRNGGNGYGTYNNGAYGNRGYSTYNNGTYANPNYGNGAYGNPNYGNGAYGNPNYGNGAYNNGAYGNPNSGNGAYVNRYGNDQYGRGDDERDDSYRNDGRDNRDDGYDRDDSDDQGGYGLRVGERAGSGLYGVPNAYRTRFRDGGGVYYRYGNGNVYQIDARTGVVLRIYAIER
ncbi:MAG TPA: hypothetical protein VH331_09145 [Allosphingosinicella sp.]|jgi:hypothetical protein|nr:hypothetical protein [Allosphingosinicella sp.]